MLTLSEERNHLRQELRTINSERDDLLSQLNDLTSRHAEDASEHESQLSTLKVSVWTVICIRIRNKCAISYSNRLRPSHKYESLHQNELLIWNEGMQNTTSNTTSSSKVFGNSG